jgi:hypothetical protein
MADLILVSILVAFIAMCVAYVGWCDRIIGTDDVERPESRLGASDTDASPTADVAVMS